MKEIDTDRLRGFAREMRRNPTQAEKRLWHELQGRRTGAKFRRQMPLGPFIPDFVCPSVRFSDIEVMESLESVVRVIRMAVMDPAFVVQEWSRERWSI